MALRRRSGGSRGGGSRGGGGVKESGVLGKWPGWLSVFGEAAFDVEGSEDEDASAKDEEQMVAGEADLGRFIKVQDEKEYDEGEAAGELEMESCSRLSQNGRGYECGTDGVSADSEDETVGDSETLKCGDLCDEGARAE